MARTLRYLDAAEVEQLSTLSEVLVRINRSAAVVKGGRRFSFSALAVSGNRAGVVGLGYGKGRQVPSAIEKAARDARKHLMRVPRTEDGTILGAYHKPVRSGDTSIHFTLNRIHWSEKKPLSSVPAHASATAPEIQTSSAPATAPTTPMLPASTVVEE